MSEPLSAATQQVNQKLFSATEDLQEGESIQATAKPSDVAKLQASMAREQVSAAAEAAQIHGVDPVRSGQGPYSEALSNVAKADITQQLESFKQNAEGKIGLLGENLKELQGGQYVNMGSLLDLQGKLIGDKMSLGLEGTAVRDNLDMPGDTLLEGMEKARPVNKGAISQKIQSFMDAFKDQTNALTSMISEVKNSQSLNIGDLIGLQVKLQEYGLTLDLTSKVADKVSQGAQTLFRNQG